VRKTNAKSFFELVELFRWDSGLESRYDCTEPDVV